MNEAKTRSKGLRWFLIYLLPPILILFLSALIVIIAATVLQPKRELQEPEPIIPAVESVEVYPDRIQLEVRSQGIAQPRTQTDLVAEVSGRVIRISPKLFAGEFFKKGDILAEIEAVDYEAALTSAVSRQAEARLAHEQELASSEQAREDWEAMDRGSPPSDLVLRKPQLERARANMESADTAVAIARRDLERTRITAPYDGRVREKFIDVGEVVSARSSQVASIYSVDMMEIRLPVSQADARFLDIPRGADKMESRESKPKVIFKDSYGDDSQTWTGVIDRGEGVVDLQTRRIHLVGQVENPYQLATKDPGPPLKAGSFVTARIMGIALDNAYRVPRRALRNRNQLYVVTEDQRIDIRRVTVRQQNEEDVIITEGLQPGERVSLTPLQYVVDGMQVALQDGDGVIKRDGSANEAAPN